MDARDKYLIFDSTNSMPAGMGHKLSTLMCAINEAIYLNRVLVLRKFAISPVQNYAYDKKFRDQLIDYALKNRQITYAPEYAMKEINFESYINLARTRIYKLEDNGDIVEIKELFRYISEEHFDLNAYTDAPESITKTDKLAGTFPASGFTEVNDQVLIAETNSPLSEEQNNQYQVVVRRTNAYGYYCTPRIHDILIVVLYPSDEVERLTDIVLRSMGTSLRQVKNRYAFYYGAAITEILNNYRKRFSQVYPLYYACLHVRGNDLSHLPDIRYGADRRNLRCIVEQAIPKKSIIYIMSDIDDPHYFDFLRKDYIVYQYFDFPELKALVSCEYQQEVDNAMLYAVEKNILQYAYTKIILLRQITGTLYTNHSYGIPWRHRLKSLFSYLVGNLLKRNTAYFSKRNRIKLIKKALKQQRIH